MDISLLSILLDDQVAREVEINIVFSSELIKSNFFALFCWHTYVYLLVYRR